MTSKNALRSILFTPWAVTILALLLLLRVLGFVMGGPEGVRYLYDGAGGIVEYGEDGLAWIWSQEPAISGAITLPDGRWTAQMVLPPCDPSTLEAAGTMKIADLSLSGTLSLETPLWSAPFNSDGSPFEIEASAATTQCELLNDGRMAFWGLFFEPVDLKPAEPQIDSPVLPDVISDEVLWIWSTSPELRGTLKLVPSAKGWSVRVDLPECRHQADLAGSDITLSIGDSKIVTSAIKATEIVTNFRPTITSLTSFTASVSNLPSCALPNDGRSVFFRFSATRL